MKSVIHNLILVFLIGLFSIPCKAQTIQMEDVGGVYKIPCTVNGLRLKMIFDPGASTVCISESTAIMMLENDYLSINDIKGTGQSQVADGSIVDHTIINLKKVQIGDKVLNNIEAVVIHGQDAPLLFGQSALRKLGQYTISGNRLIIGIGNAAQTKDVVNELSEEVLNRLYDEATEALELGAFNIALEKFQTLYRADFLSAMGIKWYADCYYFKFRE